MGCKTCTEKLFKVDFGERGFRSGIAPPMRPAFILIFIGIFLMVAGILLCILHQTYIVARTDQLYSEDNYFLVAGVIAICLGLVIVCIGGGWCYHAHTVQAEQIEDYKIRKGYSMESINRYAPSVSGSDRGSGSERGSYRHDSSRHDTSRLDSRNLSNSSYPPEYVDAHGHPAQRHPSNMSHPGYGDPRAAGHPRHHPHHHQHHPGYPDPAAAGYPPRHPSHPGYPETQSYSPPRQKDDPSMKANKGFDDFKSFVKRNVEASKADASSPRRRPYTDRLSPGYTEDEITRSRGQGQRPVSGASEEEFKLAQTYIQNPSKYYAQEAAAATNEDEDALGGYEVMPVDDPNHRRHRGRSSAHANDVATNQASRGAAYKYDKGRPLDSSLDSNTPQGQAQGHQQGHGERQPKGAAAAAAPYRYDKGRPLDSSQDSDQSYASDTQVSMATGGAGGAGAQPVIPAAVKEKATLRFNPRDGQWYYYYKGKPISKYDPDKKTGGSQDGPVYKYINGKPVLLPVPTLPLSAPV